MSDLSLWLLKTTAQTSEMKSSSHVSISQSIFQSLLKLQLDFALKETTDEHILSNLATLTSNHLKVFSLVNFDTVK